jgi:hypothetical protein
VRLAHGWRLERRSGLPPELIGEFIRPAVRAVPRAIAARLEPVHISLPVRLEGEDIVSRWSEDGETLEIAVAVGEVDPHDAALELLVCIGQALWERTVPREQRGWVATLLREMVDGVSGEIDEIALQAKGRLMADRARSGRVLEEYARAAFAATVAEYVHSLWHDVTVHAGPEHLPAPYLRRRFEELLRWFPPNPGYRLFA